MKKVSFVFAVMFITAMLMYSASMAGTLIHELTHLSHAEQPRLIEINFDTSGVTYANQFHNDTEEYAYFNGALVTFFVFTLGFFSLYIIMNTTKDDLK